jgi:hypothetical protein
MWYMMIIIMLMGWKYISEMWPPMGLLFIPPGDIWACRTMVEWHRCEKTSDTSTRAKQDELGKINDESGLQNIFVCTLNWFFTCCKVLWHGADGPLQRKVCNRFLLPVIIHCLGWVWIHEVQWLANKPLKHRGDKKYGTSVQTVPYQKWKPYIIAAADINIFSLHLNF